MKNNTSRLLKRTATETKGSDNRRFWKQVKRNIETIIGEINEDNKINPIQIIAIEGIVKKNFLSEMKYWEKIKDKNLADIISFLEKILIPICKTFIKGKIEIPKIQKNNSPMINIDNSNTNNISISIEQKNQIENQIKELEENLNVENIESSLNSLKTLKDLLSSLWITANMINN